MRIAILSGGPEYHLPSFLDPMFEGVIWVGVDRGTLTLIDKGIVPVQAFGDFDSITASEYERIQKAGIPLSTYQPEKDATDLELALTWSLEQSPEVCFLVGATGGRLDHALMNVQLLVQGIDRSTKIFLVDNQNVVTLLPPGTYNIGKRPEFNYISFIASTPMVQGLTLTGFKYPLNDHCLKWGSSLCVSNQFEETEATVRFNQGLLLVIHSRDKNT